MVVVGRDYYRATSRYRYTPLINETLRSDLGVSRQRAGIGLAVVSRASDDSGRSECGSTKPAWRREDVLIERLPTETGSIAVRWRRTSEGVPLAERRMRANKECVRKDLRLMSARSRLEVRMRRMYGESDQASHGARLLITRLDSTMLWPEAWVEDTLGRLIEPVTRSIGGALYKPLASGGLEIVVAAVDSYPLRTAEQVAELISKSPRPCVGCFGGVRWRGGAHVTDLAHALRQAGFAVDGAPSGFVRFTMRIPQETLLKSLRGVFREMDLWYCQELASCRAPIGSPTFTDVTLTGTQWGVVLSFLARRQRSALSPRWERETRVRAHFLPAFRESYFVLERLTDLELESVHDEKPLEGLREPVLNAQGYHLFGIWADGIRRERRYRSTCISPIGDGAVVLNVSSGMALELDIAAPVTLQLPTLCPH